MSQPTNNDLLNKLLDVSAIAASGLPSYGTSEVTSLRKAGKIDEAYQKAKERLAKEADNIWAKRDMSWVLYSLLKANTALEKFDTFLGYLKELDELKLPEDEGMLFDQVGWQIGKVVFGLMREQNPDAKKIKSVFDYAMNFHYTKPSEGYSFLFKAFHKAFKEGQDYISFVEWWDFNNFREEDYKKEKLPNGKDVISIAEQAIIAYVKHLLPEQTFQGATVYKKEKALSFMPFLDKVIEKHPELQYPPYFKAKLLLAGGDQQNMLSALLPFAKRKKNEFWVWDVMSEAFSIDEDKKIACYCKALTCKTSDDFLIKIRQKMAAWFVQNKMFNEARTEIENIVRTRESNEWKIPNEIANWISQDWYENAKSEGSNFKFYKAHISAAEEILYSDIPQEPIVIEFVNADKKVANFIASEQKFGFFKYDRFANSLKVGDILKVRFDGKGSEGHYKLLSLEKSEDKNFRDQYIKSIKGEIRISEGKPFGFLQDAFVHPSLIKKYRLQNKQTVEAKVIKSFNPDKKVWGWKVFEIDLTK
jgi:hypothetical protein